MPRITTTGQACYLALDLLLHAELRASCAVTKEYRLWLKQLNEALEKELETALVREEFGRDQKHLVAHYVLCWVQLLAYDNHPARQKALAFYKESVQKEFGDDEAWLKAVDHTNDIYVALTIALLQKAHERHGLNSQLVERIADHLLDNEELGFASINPTWLRDLSLMCQLEALPGSTLRLLCYAVQNGWLHSSKIQPEQSVIQEAPTLIQRLGLHEEFKRMAIYAWQFELRTSIKKQPFEFLFEGEKGDHDNSLIEVKLRQIKLDVSLFETHTGQRVLKGLSNEAESQSIRLIPITQAENQELDVLAYATKHLRMNVLVRRGQSERQAHNLGKIISYLGAQQVLKYVVHDNQDRLPVFVGGHEENTVAELISKRLKTGLGVSIQPITLYKAYADATKGIFKTVQDRWRLFQFQHSLAVLPWYQLQSLDIDAT